MSSRCTTRLATLDDIPFIDALQKKYSKQLGFFPRAQMEGYITNGWMRIAEAAGRGQQAAGSEEDLLPAANCRLPALLGFCASRDRYLKRDELGVVYQLCVDESVQRKLVGAMLLRDVFENSSYGTRLYCCWCAQDLAANKFWEAMGFVPIAFRAGSEKKARTHIFWQRRIRSGDELTPYWYPSQTTGGAIREDRIVLPIPSGTHWSEAKPMVYPGSAECKVLSAEREQKPRTRVKKAPLVRQFGPPGAKIELPAPEAKTPKPKEPKPKNDPKLIAFARELRDRWVEQVGEQQLIACAKYHVVREIETKPKRAAKIRAIGAKTIKRLAA